MIIRKDGTIETVSYLDTLYRDEKIYEDYGLNSRTLSVVVKNGKVRMNEVDSGPACAMMNGNLLRMPDNMDYNELYFQTQHHEINHYADVITGFIFAEELLRPYK